MSSLHNEKALVIKMSVQIKIIAFDEGYLDSYFFFYFSTKFVCSGYSLEAPFQGASNEYPEHTILWRNKKNINTFQL